MGGKKPSLSFTLICVVDLEASSSLSLSIVESLSLAYSVMPWMILFENFTLVSSMWRRRSAESKLRLSDTKFGGHVCVCGAIAIVRLLKDDHNFCRDMNITLRNAQLFVV